ETELLGKINELKYELNLSTKKGTLLEAQAEVSKNNNQFASRQLVKAKEKLSGTLTKKEMDNICRKQAQLAYIEMQLQEQNLEAKIEIISKN
ncbi:26279_t:CDS:2, partial [Racocetra persica]